MRSNSSSRFGRLTSRLAGILAGGLSLLLPGLALAQDASVGEVMQHAHTSFRWAFPIFSAFGWVMGTAMIIQVMNAAIQYAEAPGQKVKMTGLVARTFAASILFQLPTVLSVLQKALFGGVNGFKHVNDVDAGSGEGLDAALVFMVKDLVPAIAAIVGLIAFFSGMFMIVSGILALGNFQFQQDNVSKKGIAVRFGIGTALITFAPTVTTILQSIFNTSTANAVANTMAYSTQGLAAADAARVDNVFNAIFLWLSAIGLIAILRGLWVLYGSLEGQGKPGGLMAPMTHLIAGAALVNIVPAIKLVEATLGCGDGSACQILT